ncbi:MAG: Arc family DNA binding domain-containing protein [Saprospiraceae bacterium]
MAGKKNYALRIDEEFFAALEKWAADEFRSVNGQIEWIIDKALSDAGRHPRHRKQKPAPPQSLTEE